MSTTTLTFTLTPTSIGRIHDALSCLSKFSNEISLIASSTQLTLSALNSTKSAYTAAHLQAARFFSEYAYQGAQSQFSCRLQTKALLSVFRQRMGEGRDKGTAIQRCEVRLHNSGRRQRLQVRLHCANGVLKTYQLTYEEVDVVAALFDRGSCRQRWRIAAALLKEYIEHFGPRAEQIEISSASRSGRAAFTSFTEKLTDGREILRLPLQTSVAIDTSDFEVFDVDDGVSIAVSLKDFKAIANYAGTLDVPVEAFYSQPGKPMQIGYVRDGVDMEFTLMTASRTSQPSAAMGKIEPRVRQEIVQRLPSQSQAPPSSPPSSSRQSQPAPQTPPPPPPQPRSLTESTDSSLYRLPTPRPAPPAEPPLFLNYSSAEDDDEESAGMGTALEYERGDFQLGWNTGQEAGAARASNKRVIEDFEDSEEESEDDGVGPTQQTGYVPKGLFD
ncbi:putative DNA repair protein rad9 [Sphaerosporella brunnea]|uniref:DNA repair protein rad9 n=1 Tax=Sphaerosporella brunnea TaxID=1250544 RepID=A0A5J5F3E8_9PEZI|nr:putative DNA repair protein rad9 [Sphaerosporella brunnea]